MAQDKAPPHLLNIPAEMRNRIYQFTFGHVKELRVLRTCRQIYNEARILAYGETEFMISHMRTMYQGLPTVSIAQKAAIDKLALNIHFWGWTQQSIEMLSANSVNPSHYAVFVDDGSNFDLENVWQSLDLIMACFCTWRENEAAMKTLDVPALLRCNPKLRILELQGTGCNCAGHSSKLGMKNYHNVFKEYQRKMRHALENNLTNCAGVKLVKANRVGETGTYDIITKNTDGERKVTIRMMRAIVNSHRCEN